MEVQIKNKEGKNVLETSYSVRQDEIHFYRYDICPGSIINFVAHWHSDYDIVYVMDKYLDFIVAGKTYHLLPGQALLIHQNVVHGHADILKDYGYYLAFTFREDFLFPDPQSYLYKHYYVPFQTGEKEFSGHITGADSYEQEILSTIRELIPLSQDIASNALSIQIQLLRIFDNVYHRPANPERSSGIGQRDDINAALYYINQNFMNNISIQEISGLLYMSPDYFRRIFKSAAGISPKEYILNLRIRHSINEMMKDPEKSIMEVASQSGFPDINYFSRVFKSKTGVSPSEYKKRRLNGEDTITNQH